jgi:hypothetical protein
MIRTCSNCSLKLSTNDIRCPICQTAAGHICANCSCVLAVDMKFCENCGSPSSTQTTGFSNASQSTNNKLRSNKNSSILVGSIFGVCIIGLAGWFFSGKQGAWITTSGNLSKSNQNVPISQNSPINAVSKSFNAPAKSPENTIFTKNFSGYVNNTYVDVEITRDGNTLTGTIDESGRRIQIEGTVDDDDNFKLDELDDYGEKTGIYRGKFNSQNEMKGNWSLPNGAKPRSFLWNEN